MIKIEAMGNDGILITRESGLGGVTAWVDGGKLYIRETPKKEKTQTVCLSTEELNAIIENAIIKKLLER